MSQRRLAAIMFTDIVGYASLLKEDEKKAFETLRKNQRIHRRLIKKFNGRWLKEMESGVLASFSSIIDAITCALIIQKATEECASSKLIFNEIINYSHRKFVEFIYCDRLRLAIVQPHPHIKSIP